MERWQNRVAVVTGASSGIGAVVVKDLAEAGLIVVGLARRLDRLEKLKSDLPKDIQSRVYAFKCDVSSEQSVDSAFEWIIKTLGGVDILVNNAGTATTGNLATMEISKIRQIIETNIMGVLQCTQHAFRSMKERSFDGHVIVLNSVLGHSIPVLPGGVDFNIYPATKYAITAITEIYRQEFKGLGTKVKITSISPGVVDTEILPDKLRNAVQKCILQPKDISEGVLYAIGTPSHVQVHELTIRPI